MPEIRPFRGLRYAAKYLTGEVLAPPFDVVDEPTRQGLLARCEHNIVLVDKGPEGHAASWYAQAAEQLQRWLAQGILVQEEQPALYGYRQTFTLDGEQRTRVGLIAAVRLHPWGQGIHPHERTRLGDRRDRLLHMRAMQAQMSPVFGLFQDPEGLMERMLAMPEVPLLQETLVDGVHQSFWRIDDPATIDALCRLLAERDVVIADGHHRYETALAYREERRALDGDPAAPQPYDYVMMYLTRAEAPGLVILPTHRILRGTEPLDEEALLHALHGAFELRPLWNRERWAEALAEAGRGSVALALALPDMGAYCLRLRDTALLAVAAPDLPPEMRLLDVVVLERLVLEPLLGISPQSLAAGERVSYTVDASAALRAVEKGEAQAAFLLNPTTVEQVWQVATHGLTMPQKSTYFYPKLLTGLVIHPLFAS